MWGFTKRSLEEPFAWSIGEKPSKGLDLWTLSLIIYSKFSHENPQDFKIESFITKKGNKPQITSFTNKSWRGGGDFPIQNFLVKKNSELGGGFHPIQKGLIIIILYSICSCLSQHFMAHNYSLIQVTDTLIWYVSVSLITPSHNNKHLTFDILH